MTNIGKAFVSESPAMRSIMETIEKVAPHKLNVLITGETGVGKALVAEAIHRASPRREYSLVSVNCAAIPAQLLESELFGHVKGAYSGASLNRKGLFREADGGTLFLDEIGEFPLPLQTKLLRVLDVNKIRPVGADQEIEIDARIVAATNRNLAEMVEQKLFREDLFYRLNTFPISVPPLRERREEIPALVNKILSKFGESPKMISPEAIELLMSYSWPGNIRELASALSCAYLRSAGPEITREEVAKYLKPQPPEPRATLEHSIKEMTLAEAEQFLVKRALEAAGGNTSQAAEKLGISRYALIRLIKKLK